MNIVFLDIDGVFNSGPYLESLKKMPGVHQEIADYHVALLAEICHKYRARIVLCSTWRIMENDTLPASIKMYSYLKDCLAKHGLSIFSKTPYIGNNRPLEIRTWLREHYGIENFVIFDDDFPLEEYEKYGLKEHCVRTRYFCNSIDEGGLQRYHFPKIAGIMDEQE